MLYLYKCLLQLPGTLIKHMNGQSLFVLPGPCPTLVHMDEEEEAEARARMW